MLNIPSYNYDIAGINFYLFDWINEWMDMK